MFYFRQGRGWNGLWTTTQLSPESGDGHMRPAGLYGEGVGAGKPPERESSAVRGRVFDYQKRKIM
jgi:hypothetical protein